MPAIPPVDESARVRASLALVSSALLGSRRLRAHGEAPHRLPDRRGVALALRGCAILAAEPPCGDPLLDPGILERVCRGNRGGDGRSEEHTSELQSLMRNSYAVFCLKKNKRIKALQQDQNHMRYS